MTAGKHAVLRWLRENASGWRIDVAILALALVVRAVHLIGLLGDPLFDEPRMDPLYHDTWARHIAAGQLTADEPFFRAPLYAYFLGGIYALSGGSILVARAVQLALGALVPLLVTRIGRRIVSPRVAIAAGLVAALNPLALRFEGDLLVEGPFVVLVMLALHLQMRALERPSAAAWWWTGLVFGLAAITRPNILAFVVLLPLVIWMARRRWPWQSISERATGISAPFARGTPTPWREFAALALGIILPILPVLVHNAAAGDPTPIATQGGVNFYIGNNPHSDGFTAVVPGTSANWWGGYNDAITQAQQARGRELRMSEVSDYWLGEGLRFIASRPHAALELALRKLYLFWWGAEISNNEHVYFLRRYSLPLRAMLWYHGIHAPFGILAPLALIGMAFAVRRRPRALPLVVFVLAYMASVVLFFVCARFRYPVTPVLALFAVYAVAVLGGELGTALRSGRRGRWRHLRTLALPGATLVVLTVVLNADPYGLHPAVFGSQSLSYIDLG
ncbi:MAG: glycosyltransferase family 39 protein, partial [Candidatus Eiseniibacteriota bacterium]